MRPTTTRLLAALLATGLAGCAGESAAPEPLDPATPSFTLQASGDVARSARGFTLTSFLRNGYREEVDGGRLRDSSDVTLISLAPDGPAGPQVNLGLLGRPVVGTYRVRSGGPVGRPIGAQPEFYGSYMVPNADGTRRDYAASTGTVTITAVRPMIQGTFAFRATTVVTWPANPVPGTTVRSTPASAEFSGEFVARLP